MTVEAFWKSWFAFVLVAGPFLLGIAGFALGFYLGYRHLDTMVAALKNSRHIVLYGTALRDLGWFGRLLLVGKIAGVMCWSTNLVRAGEVNADDIRDFPPHLRRLMRLHLGMLIFSFIWMALVSLALKLR